MGHSAHPRNRHCVALRPPTMLTAKEAAEFKIVIADARWCIVDPQAIFQPEQFSMSKRGVGKFHAISDIRSEAESARSLLVHSRPVLRPFNAYKRMPWVSRSAPGRAIIPRVSLHNKPQEPVSAKARKLS